MLFRLIRLAPLAAAGWRMYQNRKRRDDGRSGQGSSTPPPQTYR
ncbi:MAG: hypothetical protein ABR500_08370 [Dermatophilaceae bacterium]